MITTMPVLHIPAVPDSLFPQIARIAAGLRWSDRPDSPGYRMGYRGDGHGIVLIVRAEATGFTLTVAMRDGEKIRDMYQTKNSLDHRISDIYETARLHVWWRNNPGAQ